MNRLTLNQRLSLTQGQKLRIRELEQRGYSIRAQYVRCSRPNCRCKTAPYLNGHLDTTYLHGPYVYARISRRSATSTSVYIGRLHQSCADNHRPDLPRTADDR